MIFARLFRWAVVASLARAWTQKSSKWAWITVALLLFRVVDLRAAKTGRKRRAKRAV